MEHEVVKQLSNRIPSIHFGQASRKQQGGTQKV